ncbi:membrane-bound lytic murein transglycosylase D [Glaciecola punicea ACAM 611]|uniref:Membrane-bound lytic murein transglycosylase D n=3 Tax=Glaciecola TaxID=89404 RepID=H5TAE3_9ALTE|nr:LysM peptidoglycan-binding domain-containing protein [Glaciecola punicea]GAB55270.1 membrane-bound lytic murein transglycosylase D [Glaciecola punicea ACAM 611]
MKFILPVGLVIALSACSVNPLVIEKEYEDVQDTIGEVNELIIDNLLPCSGELNSSDQNAGHLQDCETQSDGVIKVIHLTQEVDIALEQPDPIDPNTLNDLWEKIQYQMTLPIPQNQPRLDAQKNWYLRHPAYMQRVSKRARPFLYHITQRLEQENMPMELALLPIVESAFDPFAYSHGRASGMWQFIPSTGKRFGMKQTWWYDGRRDVIASTEGAIKYLRYLNDMFDGDWLHALAAYNSGEGRVMRAIKKNKRAGKPTDFWSLDLPRETRAYVPKLLALADILKSQDEYNFSWPKIANAPVVEIVDVSSQIDLAVAARMANLTIAELQALNPGYNRWATDPDGPHRLLLPIDKAESFTAMLAQTSSKDRLNWVRHKVKSGESLGLIARKYSTSVSVIKQVNNLKSNMIVANNYILIPVSLKDLDAYSLSADQRLVKTQSIKRANHKIEHTVNRGDTLWDLAVAHKVGVRELAKWNKMAPTDTLKVGANLVIWTDDIAIPDANSPVMRNLVYTVRSGDSLALIASRFKVRIADIAQWNNLEGEKYLQPGQKLKIRVDVKRT